MKFELKRGQAVERWKINLFTVWFSQTISIMSFSFGIPFIPFYIQELGIVQKEQINIYTAILSAAPAITMAVMAPIWGIAADRWGKKLMLLRAMLFASLIIAGMGAVTHVNQLVALRLFQGIFTGTITASSALIASGTPTPRLSYALGFLSSSTFIGSSIGPVIGGFLAEHAGYRPSFYIGGALMMLDFLLVLMLVKEERLPLPCRSEGAEDLSETVQPRGEAVQTLTGTTQTKKNGALAVFLVPVVAVMLFLIFSFRLSRSVFNPYLPLFVQEIYSSIRGAAKVTGIINGVTGLMTALAGLTLSRLGDRCNKTVLLGVLLSSAVIVSLPLGFIQNLWLFTLLYGVFFFIMGGTEPVVLSITTENTPAERRGMLFGVQGLVGSLGWVISPVLGSAVSLKYSLQSIVFLIPLTLLPALIAVFFLSRSLRACRMAGQKEESDRVPVDLDL